MARLRLRVTALDLEGDAIVGATVKFYQPGTASVVGTTTTGTPFAGSLYAAVSGGSPIPTTQTTDSNGQVVVYTATASRCDVGVESPGMVGVYSYEEFILDPADAATLTATQTLSNKTLAAQTLIGTGTLAAPSLAQEGNPDTGFNVDADGDPGISKNSIGLLEATSTTLVLRSPAGTGVFTLPDGAGLLFTPSYFMRSLDQYDVRTYGVTMNDATKLAENAAALSALPVTIGAAREGACVVIPAGDLHTNPFTWNHNQGAGASKRINVRGEKGATNLKVYTTAGPFIDIASNANSPLAHCEWTGLMIQHFANPASGATIRAGYVSTFSLKDVTMVGGTYSPFIGLQMIASASVKSHNCVFLCKDAANAVAVDFAHTIDVGGVFFDQCQISGDSSVLPTAKNTAQRGVRFNNSARVDTPTFSNTSILDHYIGIASGANTGNVENFQMNGGFLDKSAYNMSIQPSALADWGGVRFNGVWMSAEYMIGVISEINGGSVAGFSIIGESWHNATQGGILLQGGIDSVTLLGIDMDLSNTNNVLYAGIETATDGVAHPIDVGINGCKVRVGASTAACIKLSAGTTPLNVSGNRLRGGADADGIVDGGATGTARIIANNGYAA